jgi:hypothetical protein
MKTIYSLKEFHAKAAEISKSDPDLVRVQVSYGIYDEWDFWCYYNGAGQNFTGKTMEESLQKLQDHISLSTKVFDLKIEYETPTPNSGNIMGWLDEQQKSNT